MACILNLETASTNCSVALFRDGELLAVREDRSPQYSHGENLHLYIEAVLSEAGLEARQLEAVAVGKGPGSYTGLRIGVSAAKGLGYALDIPLIGLPTLRVLADACPQKAGIRIPMVDARRMEVYASVYDGEGTEIRETRAEILNPESYREFSGSPVHLIGPGAAKAAGLLELPDMHIHADLLPSALQMGPLAEAAYRGGRFEDLAYFEPYYLKNFIPFGGKSPA